MRQRELFGGAVPVRRGGLHDELRQFAGFGRRTAVDQLQVGTSRVPVYTNEFWTARQRQASRLHEISYRACFKPQLPAFFIDRLTEPNDRVYDPFMGRGTTLIEAALRGRRVAGCDINPLARCLVSPRLSPPRDATVETRLGELDFGAPTAEPLDDDLLAFYHPETLRELLALRRCLSSEPLDQWIRMVATNRLTGHSNGFFSVYTLPPNQATSPSAQRRINARRQQEPEYRDTKELILRKSRSLLSGLTDAERANLAASDPQITIGPSAATTALDDESMRLVVTSPPFLDIVQYAADNWLRCWFCGIDPDAVKVPMHRKVEQWQQAMQDVFTELARVLCKDGHVAFEVGEVRGGSVRLEESVIPAAIGAGLEPVLVLINQQSFTKTANCWGVDNNDKGTNSNRVVVLRK